MCKPCATAAECTTTETRTEPAKRRRTRKLTRIPNQLEELTAIGRAMADAALVFDQTVSICGWSGWDRDGTTTSLHDIDGYMRADAVKRASALCRAVVETLAPHFPSRPNPLPEGNSDGNTLRHVAEQMDRLDEVRGYHDGYRDDRDREYTKEELYPHLLRDRSAKDQSVCPLCGSQREFNLICVEASEGEDVQSWICNTCEMDVKKARRVLKARRMNPDKPKRKKQTKLKTAPVPVAEFALPFFGEVDCRTAEQKAADEAAGVPAPQCFIPDVPTKSKAKSKPVSVPPLHNRISSIID